ncbi:hypothetical protein [Amycolatopsis sp. TNS106]|uniref:hypothetical protein n=1 Tax=Amycolatopsis sp. TNS106 TaxID=2861750 RepID=UPI001C585F44|nr:hypothetical protein [Amycolatopsis sp. TNS106]QXV57433.1 hypothetical protein CVV72_10820 [Amycolatopsis sp. TNS106]
MNTVVDADLLTRVLTDRLGRPAAQSIITALDKATALQTHDGAETTEATGTLVASGTVEDLVNGDVFSLDQGTSWHTCAAVGRDAVSVYTSTQPELGRQTTQIPVSHSQSILVRPEWTRLYDFDGQFYARVGCPECRGEGLVQIDPTGSHGSDTDTCHCVRDATSVPERLFEVLVRETREQWLTVWACALNEAGAKGETIVRIGDDHGGKFTSRESIEIQLGREIPSDVPG